jgi:hypothetical protein
MIVELDIFSGRPNPRWRLDEAGAAELGELHHRLEVAAARPTEPPGLGYRGFLYSLDGVPWRAWHGFVTSSDRTLADRSGTIERLLLAGLPEEHAYLRAPIAEEIQGAA